MSSLVTTLAPLADTTDKGAGEKGTREGLPGEKRLKGGREREGRGGENRPMKERGPKRLNEPMHNTAVEHPPHAKPSTLALANICGRERLRWMRQRLRSGLVLVLVWMRVAGAAGPCLRRSN